MKKSNKKTDKEQMDFNIIPKPKKPEEMPPPPPPPAPPQPPKQPGDHLRENGILFMDKDFDQENCMPIVKMIMEYNLMPEDKAPEIIHLYINSPGGLVASAFHLIDVIKQSRIPVYTYGMGIIASCGVFLMMSGEKGHRYITPNTMVMSHEYSSGKRGKHTDLVDVRDHEDWLYERMITHYKKCTGKSEAYIKKHLLPTARDKWLTPEEAVKHGIADKMVETY